MSLLTDNDAYCQSLNASVTAPDPAGKISNILLSIVECLTFEDTDPTADTSLPAVTLAEQIQRRAQFGAALVNVINLNDGFMLNILKVFAKATVKTTPIVPYYLEELQNNKVVRSLRPEELLTWKINLGNRAHEEATEKGVNGYCAHATNTIKLRHDLTAADYPETVIHEMFHVGIAVLYNNAAVPYHFEAPPGDKDLATAEKLFKDTDYDTKAAEWAPLLTRLQGQCKNDVTEALEDWVRYYKSHPTARLSSGIEELYGYFISIIYYLAFHGLRPHDDSLVANCGAYSEVYENVQGLVARMMAWAIKP